MSGLYQQIAAATGRTDLPIIYRDQLIDPGCLSLIEFGHGWGYAAQASPIAAGTVLRNYHRSGNTVAINGTPVWSGRCMVLAGVSTIGLLGAEWLLASTVTHFAIGGFWKMPTSGYLVSGTGTGAASLFGWAQANGANGQYGVRVNYNRATGVAQNVYLLANNSLVDVTPVWPADGAIHHFAMEMERITPTTFQIRLYVDGLLVFTSSALAWSGSLVVPGTGVPTIGAFVPTYIDTKGAIGRLWLWNLSNAGSKSIGELIAADIAQNAGRFS